MILQKYHSHQRLILFLLLGLFVLSHVSALAFSNGKKDVLFCASLLLFFVSIGGLVLGIAFGKGDKMLRVCLSILCGGFLIYLAVKTWLYFHGVD